MNNPIDVTFWGLGVETGAGGGGLMAYNNLKRAQGQAARASGDKTESDFDASCEYLTKLNLIRWIPTYPETGGKPGKMFYTGAAPPDRVIWLKNCQLLVELKTVTNKNLSAIRDIAPKGKPNKRKVMRQLEFLQDFEAFGILGCIIVRWKFKGLPDEWLLYWANNMSYDFASASISISRGKEKPGYSIGEAIPFDDNGILDWIPVVERRLNFNP